MFNASWFPPSYFTPSWWPETGATPFIPPVPLPGLGGGISPGFDFEGVLNQFGTPPAAWLAPPAPPVAPVITEYAGAGAPTTYLGGLGPQGYATVWATTSYLGGDGGGSSNYGNVNGLRVMNGFDVFDAGGGVAAARTAVLAASAVTVISVEGTVGYAEVKKLVSPAPAGSA